MSTKYPIEEWREVPELNLWVSTWGRIFNPIRGDFTFGRMYTTGYFGYLSLAVHRVIAYAFMGDCYGLVVNHIDGDKSNNCIWNLEYVTNQENSLHATYVLGDMLPCDVDGTFCETWEGIKQSVGVFPRDRYAKRVHRNSKEVLRCFRRTQKAFKRRQRSKERRQKEKEKKVMLAAVMKKKKEDMEQALKKRLERKQREKVEHKRILEEKKRILEEKKRIKEAKRLALWREHREGVKQTTRPKGESVDLTVLDEFDERKAAYEAQADLYWVSIDGGPQNKLNLEEWGIPIGGTSRFKVLGKVKQS